MTACLFFLHSINATDSAADGSATRIHNYNDGGNSGELKSRTPHKTIHKPKLIAFFGER